MKKQRSIPRIEGETEVLNVMCQHFNIKHRIATKSTLMCFLQLPQHTAIIFLNKKNQFVSTLRSELSYSILMTVTAGCFFGGKRRK